MKTKTKPTLLDEISTLCDDKSSFRARVALNSFHETSSSIILDKIILLLEYVQIVSPLFIIVLFLHFNPQSALFQAVLFIARLTNPSYWMSFEKTGALVNAILIIVCLLTFTKLLMLLYIIYISRRAFEPKSSILILWRFLMKLQARITYFYVASFYIIAVRVLNWDTFVPSNDQTESLKIVMFIFIAIEAVMAFIPKIRFHNILPSKSFISSKENTIEVITLVQKIVIQALTSTLDYAVEANFWIFFTINICFDVFRLTNFFVRLPLYSFKALLFQGWLLVAIASLNFACFVSLIVKSIDETKSSLAFVLVLWVVLLILGVGVSNNFLKSAFWRLVCDPDLKASHLLVHRIVAIKELQGLTEESCEHNDKCDFYFLMSKTLDSHLEKILWVENNSNETLDLKSKACRNKLFKNYLEKVQEKFPRNQSIQLYLAEFYFKRMKIMSDSIRFCLKLRKNGGTKMRPNAELLLNRIQSQIKTSMNPYIDINSFLAQQSFVAKLKQEMRKQTDFQIKICFEIMKDNPNLEQIYSNAQKAKVARQKVTKGIRHMSVSLNDFNIEPLLTAAKYCISVNHSLQDSFALTKLYSQKHIKYQRFFSQEKLCQENVFQENMGFLFISGAKGKEGNIIYGTKQIDKILGGDMRDYAGVSLVERAPPLFRPLYYAAWRQVSESPDITYLGKVDRCHLYHVNGYLVEVEYFIHVHPFATQGFNFIFIIRPVVSERQSIILHENGDIDSASKILIERLGLRPHVVRTNIKAINEELGRVNEAFNMMAYPQRYETEMKGVTLSKVEAEEICSKYTTDGVNIVLNSVNGGMSYSYHCKVQSLVVGPLIIKTLALEENKRENRERTNDILSPTNQKSPVHHKKEVEIFKENNSSNSFDTEEEKEEGWIDFDIMASKKYPSDTIQSPTQVQTEREMLGGDTLRTQREDTQRHLLTTRLNRVNPNFQNATTLKRAAEYNNKYFSDSTHERPETEDHHRAKIPQSSKNSGKLSRQQKRISSVFQASLDARYYSKAFKGLLGLFYITLIIFFVARIIVKVVTDNDMESLVAKKDIFINNGFRGYHLIETSGITRYIWQFYSGALNISDYGAAFAANYEIQKRFIKFNINNLRDYNRAILKSSSILDEEAYNILYSKNVRIYNTYFDDPVQSYTMMNSFQACDQIVEAALYVYSGIMEQPSVTPEMMTRAEFLFRNAINDVIFKTARITFAMVDSFNQQFQYVVNLSLAFNIMYAMLLFAFAVVFCLFICKQYASDTFYISAICRLNHNRVQIIHKEFISFQKYLQDQEETGNPHGVLKKSQYHQNNAKSVEDISTNQVKRETMKNFETKDFLKRSLFYMIGVVFVVIILLVLTLYIQLTGKDNLDKMKSNQEKLSFLSRVRVTTAMATIAFKELTATNNTAYAENMRVLDKLELATTQLATLRVGIYSEIMTGEILEDNPELETLLLGDGCTLLNSTFDFYCELLKQKGKSRGLIYLMNEFNGYLTGKIQDYQDSNKTVEALNALQIEDYDVISLIYVITLYEVDYLWNKINQQFEKHVMADKDRRASSLIAVFIIIFLAGTLGWKYILKELGDSILHVKNILRVFPAELVLSSFLLKNFLAKTSNGTLDQIKNEI